MGDFQDLTGCQFGELTVVRLYRKCANGGSTWHCRCSCGREVDLPASDLLKGRLTCGACNYGHYCFYPGYAECLLPNGNSFLIDIQDYPVVSRYRWVKTREGYFSASCGKRNSHITLHRLIMNPPAGMLVDHIDGNKNNCRRTCVSRIMPGTLGTSKPKRITSADSKVFIGPVTETSGVPRSLRTAGTSTLAPLTPERPQRGHTTSMLFLVLGCLQKPMK